MVEAANTSETLVNFYQITQHNNPEDSHLSTFEYKPARSIEQGYKFHGVSGVTCPCTSSF